MAEPPNDDNMHSMPLTHGTFWVQLHGVPGFYMTIFVAQAIGAMLGDAIRVDNRDGSDCEGALLLFHKMVRVITIVLMIVLGILAPVIGMSLLILHLLPLHHVVIGAGLTFDEVHSLVPPPPILPELEFSPLPMDIPPMSGDRSNKAKETNLVESPKGPPKCAETIMRVKRRSSGRGRREAIFVGSDRFHLWSKAAQRPNTDTLRLFNNQHLEMGSNVELVWPESEAYSSRVNNCSHANSSLAVIRAKLSAEQLEQFKTSCFGHLLNIDKIQFSGQIVHGVGLRRVAGQGVKDLDGLSFLIGCDVAQFTRHDFCLISGLRFGEVPEVSSGESDEIRLQKRYFIDEGITCNALEEAFVRCTEEDDVYKLALVYFAELVVLGRDKHLNINLNYLTLVEDLDAFNRFPWGSVSFDKTQDSLFSAPTKYVKSFENEEGRGKGKSKVTGTSRRNEKCKKDNHGEVQRGGWSFKGFTYAFQIWVYELIPRMADLNYCKVVDPTALPRILRWRTTTSVPEMRKLNNYFFQSKESVQLRVLCPSEEEMRQPYWSWPQGRPAVVSAESIPSSCGDLDELNKAVSLLRSELFQVKREKDVLELKVIRMEKILDHCLGPHFEQEVRRDIALLKERTNRCVVSHLFKGYEEVDGMQWDEGPSNRNEGEENEDEDIEGGEGPNNRNEGEDKEEEGIERGEGASKTNEGEEKEEEGIEGGEMPSKRNEGEEKEEEGIEGGEVQRKPREVEEAQRKRSEGEQVKIKSSKGEEAQRKSIEGEEELKRKSSEGKDPQKKKKEGQGSEKTEK
ncbi:unnamed protein product [Prunus armeniaca]